MLSQQLTGTGAGRVIGEEGGKSHDLCSDCMNSGEQRVSPSGGALHAEANRRRLGSWVLIVAARMTQAGSSLRLAILPASRAEEE